jgi:hypothetical protein
MQSSHNAVAGAESIRDVILFPLLEPKKRARLLQGVSVKRRVK